jgi:opacity protein-like surface antigen
MTPVTTTNAALAVLLALSLSPSLAAQTRPAATTDDDPPAIALRAFVLAAGESFAAKETFTAIFGQSFESFLGGGLELVQNGVFIDVAASRFRKTGQRAFRSNGQNFRLGIPLTVTITPFEVTGGYRFRTSPRLFPYAGIGVGSYGYRETAQFSDPAENLDTRHTGFLVVGGAEVRVHRWVGISGDVQYTHVAGILGTAGISKEAGEKDLGGLALRVKVTVGR